MLGLLFLVDNNLCGRNGAQTALPYPIGVSARLYQVAAKPAYSYCCNDHYRVLD